MGLCLKAVTTCKMGPVEWQIKRGECVSLSGESGSGKSLLLRAIADLDTHGGEVLLDGVSAEAMPAHLWRRRVALLPAEPYWWGQRVGEHFTHYSDEWMQQLGLEERALAWEVARCSTGERQRLALLRLLQNRPEVLLLDEPTAALDPTSVGQVEALLQNYRESNNAVVVLVSHDEAQCRRVAQRYYRIVDGQLREVPL